MHEYEMIFGWAFDRVLESRKIRGGDFKIEDLLAETKQVVDFAAAYKIKTETEDDNESN